MKSLLLAADIAAVSDRCGEVYVARSEDCCSAGSIQELTPLDGGRQELSRGAKAQLWNRTGRSGSCAHGATTDLRSRLTSGTQRVSVPGVSAPSKPAATDTELEAASHSSKCPAMRRCCERGPAGGSSKAAVAVRRLALPITRRPAAVGPTSLRHTTRTHARTQPTGVGATPRAEAAVPGVARSVRRSTSIPPTRPRWRAPPRRRPMSATANGPWRRPRPRQKRRQTQ